MTDKATETDKRIAADLMLAILDKRVDVLRTARNDKEIVEQMLKIYASILDGVKAS
ncbi:MAG: hypothetical protein U5L02_16455 [Rheinheimera sp.]|nr:hypothetical protein [Rheinheimera sp.]